jgi:hypothetical protein
MKDLQILWASFKYHIRKIKEFFIEPELTKSDIQRKLYWSAYRAWQDKRGSRRMCNIGTDLFEKDTNCSAFYRRKLNSMNPIKQ